MIKSIGLVVQAMIMFVVLSAVFPEPMSWILCFVYGVATGLQLPKEMK